MCGVWVFSSVTVRNLYRSGICVREFVPFLEVSRVEAGTRADRLDTRACMWNLPALKRALLPGWDLGARSVAVGVSCDTLVLAVARRRRSAGAGGSGKPVRLRTEYRSVAY